MGDFKKKCNQNQNDDDVCECDQNKQVNGLVVSEIMRNFPYLIKTYLEERSMDCFDFSSSRWLELVDGRIIKHAKNLSNLSEKSFVAKNPPEWCVWGDGEKGHCLFDFNRSIVSVCNPAVNGGNIDFYMSFMLTGYAKNSRRAKLFSFFNQGSGEDCVRDSDKLVVEMNKKGKTFFNVFGTAVRYKSGELIIKWVVLHLRIDAVSGCSFSLNGVGLFMGAFGDVKGLNLLKDFMVVDVRDEVGDGGFKGCIGKIVYLKGEKYWDSSKDNLCMEYLKKKGFISLNNNDYKPQSNKKYPQ